MIAGHCHLSNHSAQCYFGIFQDYFLPRINTHPNCVDRNVNYIDVDEKNVSPSVA